MLEILKECKIIFLEIYFTWLLQRIIRITMPIVRPVQIVGLAQREKALGTKNYKPGPGLPLLVIKHVKPIYKDFSHPQLLNKCLHGKTHNANESFHGMIWKRIPKTSHVGRNV